MTGKGDFPGVTALARLGAISPVCGDNELDRHGAPLAISASQWPFSGLLAAWPLAFPLDAGAAALDDEDLIAGCSAPERASRFWV